MLEEEVRRFVMEQKKEMALKEFLREMTAKIGERMDSMDEKISKLSNDLSHVKKDVQAQKLDSSFLENLEKKK
jgi:hypothetical protein